MKRILLNLLIIVTSITFAIKFMMPAVSGEPLSTPFAAPEFTHKTHEDWINSDPLMLSDLRGKVLLVDFWTFDCWNCYRSFPWLKALEMRLAPKGLQVVGVHSPEFSHEKVFENIVSKVKEFGLHHPIMVDNDFSYWRVMRNKYWPAFYIIDKQGQVRAIHYGETHEGDPQAMDIEKTIEQLLTESS